MYAIDRPTGRMEGAQSGSGIQIASWDGMEGGQVQIRDGDMQN